MKTAFLSALLVLFCCAMSSMATVIEVSPGVNAIQIAIDQTVAGDTVLVGEGVYTDNFYLTDMHPITILGEVGAVVQNATAICSSTPEGTLIQSLSFTGSLGSAVTGNNGAHVNLRNISVSGRNSSPAMFFGSGSHVLVEGCEFSDNQNDVRCYATRSGSFGTVELRNSVFRGNHSSFQPQLLPHIGEDGRLYYELEDEVDRDNNYGGALYITLGHGQANALGCLFVENNVLSVGSVVYNRTANFSSVACTYVNNSSGNGSTYWGSVDDNWGSDSAYFQDCLFVGNANSGQEVIHSDDLVIAGHNGAWPHNHGISSAVVADPLFCDPENGDFRLGDDSPYLPENNQWGVQFGAFGAGNCQGVDVEQPTAVPADFDLAAYPNPFNPSTTISFSLFQASHVNLTVYNLNGDLVATLADGMMSAGHNEVSFDASSLSSGMYIYTLMANDLVTTGKIMLVK